MPEVWFHVHVQPVVDKHEFWFPGRQAPDEDIPRMWIAMYPSPKEHLRREKVYHCGHDILQRQAESTLAILALPPVPIRLDSLID